MRSADSVPRPSILVVEDSPDIVRLLQRVLSEHGYAVRVARDGETGLRTAVELPPDLMILDVGLPGCDGFHVIAELRRRSMAIPVLMLTARGRVRDRVSGLEAGADDYLAKPFDQHELVARVRALMRRATLNAAASRLSIGNLVLDPLTREVYRGGRRIALTQREFALLEYLMRHSGHIVSRSAIANEVWRQAPIDIDETNIVDVYVAYLRKKLDGEHEEPMLRTVRGAGYVLREPSPSCAAGD